MKVLFLDIDGVLNSYPYLKAAGDFGSGIDESRVRLLKRIVGTTGAKIILSSSWRIDWDPGMDEKKRDPSITELVGLLHKYDMEISGKTPMFGVATCDQLLRQSGYEEGELLDDEYGYYRYGRAFEIQAWLSSCAEPVTSFVILDDNDFNWRLLGYHKRWVRTSWKNGGLKERDVMKAIHILKLPLGKEGFNVYNGEKDQA